MTTTTENKKATKIQVKDIDLNSLTLSQIMELLAKKEEMAKKETATAIDAAIKAVESNKDIKKVFETTNFVKLVVFKDESSGKVMAKFMEKQDGKNKDKAEDGRASKCIMTIHDAAGNVIDKIMNTRKPDRFFEYLGTIVPEFKGKTRDYIQGKYKEESEKYLKLLESFDSNKFRIVK